MIRLGTLLWLALVALAGFGLFELKYRVQAQERELARLDRQIRNDRDEMRDAVRKAEVKVDVAGQEVTLVSANYRLPITVAGVQIVRFDALPARQTPVVEEFGTVNPDSSIVTLLSQLGALSPAAPKLKP